MYCIGTKQCVLITRKQCVLTTRCPDCTVLITGVLIVLHQDKTVRPDHKRRPDSHLLELRDVEGKVLGIQHLHAGHCTILHLHLIGHGHLHPVGHAHGHAHRDHAPYVQTEVLYGDLHVPVAKRHHGDALGLRRVVDLSRVVSPGNGVDLKVGGAVEDADDGVIGGVVEEEEGRGRGEWPLTQEEGDRETNVGLQNSLQDIT